MKVFKFNPETGRKGAQIDAVRRASWASGRNNEYAGEEPNGFGKAEVTVHLDAGIGMGDDEVSYLRDEWVCFCLGEWQHGPDDYRWEWVVLAPRVPTDPRQIDYPADSDIDTRYT